MSADHGGRIVVGRQGVVGVITLDHPTRRNAVSVAMAAELASAVDALEADQSINAIVVTGAGQSFCAGGDLNDLIAARDGDAARLKDIYRGFVRLLECRLPTIAAVNGPAVGAGFNLALACDVRIASTDAYFDTRFLGIGLHPGGGHTWMLTRAVGAASAARLLLFASRIDGAEAERIGLVERCVAFEDLLATAVELASRAGALPRQLLMETKQTLRAAAAPDATHPQVLELEYERQVRSLRNARF